MANEEHLVILRQGVPAWNAWRTANPGVRPDLSEVNFIGAELSEANLRGADLREAILNGADLSEADLRDTNLRVANLGGADLRETNLNGASLTQTNFLGVTASNTLFINVDLSESLRLDTIRHFAPSTIGIDTLVLTQGKVPEAFLRSCGVPESLIEYLPSLIGAMGPIHFYSCFISYSTKDQAFAQRLYDSDARPDYDAQSPVCYTLITGVLSNLVLAHMVE